MNYKDVEFLGGSIDSLGQSLLKRRLMEQQGQQHQDQVGLQNRRIDQDESQFKRKLELDTTKADDAALNREAVLGQRESALEAKTRYQEQMMALKEQLANATDETKRDALGASGVKATLKYLESVEPEAANKQWSSFIEQSKQTPGALEKLRQHFPVETGLAEAGLPVFSKSKEVPPKAPVVQPPHMSIIDKGGGEKATNYYNVPIGGTLPQSGPSNGGAPSRKAIIKRPDGTALPITY